MGFSWTSRPGNSTTGLQGVRRRRRCGARARTGPRPRRGASRCRACRACPSCRRCELASRRKGRPACRARGSPSTDAADEVRGRVAARAVVPPAVQPVAAVDAHGPGRQVGERAAEVTVAEELDLALLGPHGHLVRVAGGEREDPAAGRAPARQLDGDAQEGLEAELEAAEAPRLDDAEEARLDVVAVGLVGEAAERLAFGLALAQRVAHRGGSGHQLVRRRRCQEP